MRPTWSEKIRDWLDGGGIEKDRLVNIIVWIIVLGSLVLIVSECAWQASKDRDMEQICTTGAANEHWEECWSDY